MGGVVLESRREAFSIAACACAPPEGYDHAAMSVFVLERRALTPLSPASEKELLEIDEVLDSIASAIPQESNRVASTMVAVATFKLAAARVLAGTFSAIGAFGTTLIGIAIASLSGAAAISASAFWIGSAFGPGAIAGAYLMTGEAIAVGMPAAFFARRKLISPARSSDKLTNRERATLLRPYVWPPY